jgi:hypothetical protein
MPPTNPSIIGISQFASNSRLHQSIVEYSLLSTLTL